MDLPPAWLGLGSDDHAGTYPSVPAVAALFLIITPTKILVLPSHGL